MAALALVVEIVSPSNTFVEMARKFDLYRRAGAREYWVVNPGPETLFVYRFDGDEIITRLYRAAGSVRSGLFPGLICSLTFFTVLVINSKRVFLERCPSG